jgi:hypothetical protein
VRLAELLSLTPGEAGRSELVLGVGLPDCVAVYRVLARLALIPHPAVVRVGIVGGRSVPHSEEVAALRS